MADKSILDRLKSALTSSPGATEAKAVPQMGGMAGKAQSDIKNRAYQLHLQEMKAMGQMPLTPEQFANTH